MDIQAPRIAKAWLPGQFLIIRTDEISERIPFTICDSDKNENSVTIIFKIQGKSTLKLSQYNVDDYIYDCVGPLGQPSDLLKQTPQALQNKKLLFIADDVSATHIYPHIKWLSENNIKPEIILHYSSSEHIYEDKLKSLASTLYVSEYEKHCVRNTSYDLLEDLLQNQNKLYDEIIAISSLDTMKSICEITKGFNIKTTVSLKQIILDGLGLCGGCRLTVNGKMQFACIDGPEFDGHSIIFEELANRQSMYDTKENFASPCSNTSTPKHTCHIDIKS